MPVHSSAIIHPDAHVDPTSEIGPYVVVEDHVTIGPDCRIGASSHILSHTEIGRQCEIAPHAVLGDLPQDRKFDGEESYCRIGARCTIGEGVTIHRATGIGQITIVGNDCQLHGNAHVAHNCELAEQVRLDHGALLEGHVRIQRGASIAANVGVHQFVRIGAFARINAVAMIAQDVPPFAVTNTEGRIVGIHEQGMTEADLLPEECQEVRQLFQLFYHSGSSQLEALTVAREIATTPTGREFLDFFEEASRRGLRRSAD